MRPSVRAATVDRSTLSSIGVPLRRTCRMAPRSSAPRNARARGLESVSDLECPRFKNAPDSGRQERHTAALRE